MKAINNRVQQFNMARLKVRNTKSVRELICSIPRKTLEKVAFILLLLWVYTPIMMMLYNMFLDYTEPFQKLKSNRLLAIEWFTKLQQIGFFGLVLVALIVVRSIIRKQRTKPSYCAYFLKNNTSFALLFLLIVMSIISCIASENISLSFFGDKYRKDGLVSYFAYFGIFACAYVIRDRKIVKYAIKHLVHVAALMSLLTLLNAGSINSMFGLADNKAVFDNINHFGYFLCLAAMCSTIPIITKQRLLNSIFYILEYTVIIAALTRNQSLGPYLAVIVGLLCLSILTLWLHKKMFKRVLVILVIFFTISAIMNMKYGHIISNFLIMHGDINSILLDPTNALDAGTNRWGLWLNGIKFAMEKPLFGYGPDNLGSQYALLGITIDRPHNIFIQIAASLGIPALIFYVSALIKHFISYIKHRRALTVFNLCLFSSVVAYLTSSFFGNSMFYTTPFFCMILGFSLSMLKRRIYEIQN